MPRLDVPKEIERIIVLHADGPLTVHRAKRRRRQSKTLKPYAKYARTTARAQLAQAQTFMQLQSRSEAKKKDGWLKDSARNSAKAQRRAGKIWRRAYV